jgi:tRNA(fMet)-specific endonuclease VapC
MVFLDTNVVIAVMTRRSPILADRMEAELRLGTKLHLSAVVLSELDYGARKSSAPQRNLERIAEFLSAIASVAAFDAEDAAHAGDIRAYLESRGTPVGANDLLISAQARRRSAVLVTVNRREFDRVPGLIVTDWGAGG